MEVVRPLCEYCQNRYADGTLRCRAFPDGIPEAIITQEADHRVPFDGDNGILFESDGFVSDQEIAQMFGPTLPASSSKSLASRLRGRLYRRSSSSDEPTPGPAAS